MRHPSKTASLSFNEMKIAMKGREDLKESSNLKKKKKWKKIINFL